MIFEMTQDYAVIVPLMITNLISLFIASRLAAAADYTKCSPNRTGFTCPGSHARQRNPEHRVARIMRAAPEPLRGELSVRSALEQIGSSESRAWLVADRRGLIGVVNLATLMRAAEERPDGQGLGELVDASVFPHVHPDHGLDLALERMGADRLEMLPVVSRADVHNLEGVVTLLDVLRSYGVGGDETGAKQ